MTAEIKKGGKNHAGKSAPASGVFRPYVRGGFLCVCDALFCVSLFLPVFFLLLYEGSTNARERPVGAVTIAVFPRAISFAGNRLLFWKTFFGVGRKKTEFQEDTADG